MSVVFSQFFWGEKIEHLALNAVKEKVIQVRPKKKVTCLLAFVCMHGNVVVNLVLDFNNNYLKTDEKVTEKGYYIYKV